jgi:hypothetical protein
MVEANTSFTDEPEPSRTTELTINPRRMGALVLAAAIFGPAAFMVYGELGWGLNIQIISMTWALFIENTEAIEVVHIHDWVNGLQSHQIVGEGEIDFETSMQLLSGLKQPVQYVFEVRPRKSAQESLERFANLLKDLNFNLL